MAKRKRTLLRVIAFFFLYLDYADGFMVRYIYMYIWQTLSSYIL